MRLEAARGLALYAICVGPLSAALAAWERGPALPLWLGLFAILLSLAIGGADWIADRLAGVELAWRPRWRVLGSALYSGCVVLSLLALLLSPEPRLAAALAWLFASLSPLLVLASAFSGSLLAPLENALVLCVVAAAGGGWPAVLAVVSFAGALPFLFAFDHYARTLAAFPARSVSLVGPASRAAAALAAPGVAAATAFMALLPPAPHVRLSPALRPLPVAAQGPGLTGLLVVAMGLTGLSLLARLLRSARRSERSTLGPEIVELEALEDERLELRRVEADYAGARGRIVRAYVSVLARAARAGWKRRVGQTPGEFLAHTRLYGLEALTALFVRARYGPDEPAEAEAAQAEAAARTLVGALSRSRVR